MRKVCLLLLLLLLGANGSFSADYYAQGVYNYKRGDYPKAKSAFASAVSSAPGNANYRYYYAHTLLKLGDIENAAMQYNSILMLNPNTDTAKLAMRSLSYINKYYEQSRSRVSGALGTEVSKNLQQYGDSYIENALNANGTVTKWTKMPVNVYIQPSDYNAAVRRAFDVWYSQCRPYLSFVFTSNSSGADIVVNFSKSLEGTSTDKSYLAGLTKPLLKGDDLYKVTISLLTVDPSTKKSLVQSKVFSTAVHEIGHAVGIQGHSDNNDDLMSSYALENETKTALSSRDVLTVKLLYSLSDDNLAGANVKSDKLTEANAYVKKFPDKAVGWGNLGDVYKSHKKYEEAIGAYQKALSLEPKNAEYNHLLASCYAQKNDYENSIVYYQKSLDIEKNQYVLAEFIRLAKKINRTELIKKYTINQQR